MIDKHHKRSHQIVLKYTCMHIDHFVLQTSNRGNHRICSLLSANPRVAMNPSFWRTASNLLLPPLCITLKHYLRLHEECNNINSNSKQSVYTTGSSISLGGRVGKPLKLLKKINKIIIITDWPSSELNYIQKSLQ